MDTKALLNFEPQSLFLSLEEYRGLMRENFDRLNTKLGHTPVIINFGPEEDEITAEEALPKR